MERKLEQYNKRLSALKTERASWLNDWQEIQRYILPLSGRFLGHNPNEGTKKTRLNDILDNTGTVAHRTLVAGMMSGMTSPARPWFALEAPDPDLNEFAPVKEWLHIVNRAMLGVFAKSNFYRALHIAYGEMGAFGTASILISESDRQVIHCYNSTAGEYLLANDETGLVDTFYREFKMTVAQLVQRFGLNACSNTVRNLYTSGSLDAWVKVVHCIEPRSSRQYDKVDNLNMPFKSCYYELGNDEDKVLSESGFNEFPVMAPRWDLLAGDVYGTGPALHALGDIKQLQQQQMSKAIAIELQARPPLQGPAEMQNFEIDSLPGGVTFVPGLTGANAGFRNLYDVNVNLNYLLEDIQDVRRRIESAFYADLFTMLAMTDKRMTATEVAERHEEKLLMIGPVLERLQDELLGPAIDRTFAIMMRQGLIPEPPEELQGEDLRVKYVSMLAQAQRAVGTQAIDRLAGFVMSAAQANPEVLDKFDFDQAVDEYGDMLGTNPKIVRPDDDVEEIRQQRAQMQQAAMAQEQAAQAAQSAKTLSDINVEDRSALTEMFGNL